MRATDAVLESDAYYFIAQFRVDEMGFNVYSMKRDHQFKVGRAGLEPATPAV